MLERHSRFRVFQQLIALLLTATTLQYVSWGQSVVRCESSNSKRKYCAANTSGGVSLRYQYSSDGCWQNDTWGFDSGGIWVTNGCRADFTLGAASPQQNQDSGSSNLVGGLLLGALAGVAIGAAVANRNNSSDNYDDYRNSIRCESNDMRYHRCGARNIRYAEVGRQHSGSPCQYGRTWGYARSYIWVDRGCRADFWVR